MKAGRFEISEEVILDFLDFHGGHITSIHDRMLKPGVIALTIEHPDMPEVEEEKLPSAVSPSYERIEDSMGHFIMRRIDPPKSQ